MHNETEKAELVPYEEYVTRSDDDFFLVRLYDASSIRRAEDTDTRKQIASKETKR